MFQSAESTAPGIFYFDVPGIMCTSCKALIETKLDAKPYVKNVTVDVANKTVKVIVHAKAKVSAASILEEIEKCGDKFKGSSIIYNFQKDEPIYCGMKNLNTEEEAAALKLFLSQQTKLIASFELLYETKGLKLVFSSPKGLDALNLALKEMVGLKHILIEPIETPNKNNNKNNLSKIYYRNAGLNLLVGLPLWVVGVLGLIASPLLPLGQLLGLGIGGITLGVMYVSGKSFYKDAWDQFWNHRNYNMNTLIAIGTGSAWLYSMMLVLYPWGFAAGALHYEFMAVNFILGIVNMGKGVRESLQEKTRNQVKSINDMFLEMQPQYAARVMQSSVRKSQFSNLSTEQIDFRDIQIGDIIEVKKNERIPVEGVIIGFRNNVRKTAIDQSTLTGEARQLVKRKHEEVASGSLNKGETFYFRATSTGAKSNLYQIIKNAQSYNNTNELSMSKTIDKIAKYFVPSILVIAALTGIGWLLVGPAQISLTVQSVLSVLLCACPCALGLATPITTNISVNKLFGQGVLVHKANALETVSNVNIMVFDKTGTLTIPAIERVSSFDPEYPVEKVLNYAASLEASSDHPIAQSFQHNMENKLPTFDFKEITGGIQGLIVEGSIEKSYIPIKVCAQAPNNDSVQTRFASRDQALKSSWDKKGYTSLYVYLGQPVSSAAEVSDSPEYKMVGMIALKHQLRDDAEQVVRDLRNKNVEVYILSGDDDAPTQKIADELNIPRGNVFANQKPTEKLEIIRKIRQEKITAGLKPVIGMIGDGVNDIKALNGADLSIAVGPWTPASTSSDIAVHRLSQVAKLMLVSNQAMRNIYQNLTWTGLYNTFSLLAATGLLYAWAGIVVNPIMASFGMALSSIVVVFNSNSLSDKIDKLLGNNDGWKDAFTDTLTGSPGVKRYNVNLQPPSPVKEFGQSKERIFTPNIDRAEVPSARLIFGADSENSLGHSHHSRSKI